MILSSLNYFVYSVMGRIMYNWGLSHQSVINISFLAESKLIANYLK